jgi:hypothetical protein
VSFIHSNSTQALQDTHQGVALDLLARVRYSVLCGSAASARQYVVRMLPGVGWAGDLGAGWAAVVLWIGLLAWALLQLEASDGARGLPIGNVLRDR